MRYIRRVLSTFLSLAPCLLFYADLVAADECTDIGGTLVSHYPMDSSAGSSVNDTVTSLPALSRNTQTVVGQVGSAQRFNSNSEMTAGQNDLPVSTAMSLSMWVKPAAVSHVESRFVSKAYGTNNDEHFLMAGAFDRDALRFRLKTGGPNGATTTLVSRRGTLVADVWTFVTFVYNGRAMSIYKDGALVAQTAKTGIISRDATVPMTIGNQPSGTGRRPFIGDIDDVRFYDSALSAVEISTLMALRSENCNSSSPDEVVEDLPVAIDLDDTPPVTVIGSNGWPSGTDENLSMAGIFYGQHEAGLVTGNNSIGYESSRRFRAEKSGFINAVKHNNRTLLESNINNRCNPAAPDSLWCKCKTAGLDRFSCGYTLGNSYTVGNGGAIVIEVRKNDESNRNRPVSSALGKTAGVFVPLQRANEHYPTLALEKPVWLEAGEIYHLVYTNKNPPSRCKLTRMSVAEAASCPRNEGAMGLNGTLQPVLFGASKKFGPFGGDMAGNLVKTSINGSWSENSAVLSWYEVGYTDGTWIGDAHTGYGSTANGRQFIGGSTLGRQVFTVRDSSRTVDGLWLYYGHTYNSRPDGSSMKVTVRDSGNRSLATGFIKSSRECADAASNGLKNRNFREQHCRVWEYTDLSNPVDFVEGMTYSVEFSASSNAGYSLHTFFPLNYGVYQSSSRNIWNDAHAEVSKDSGNTWEKWTGSYYPDRDINMLFTVQGMPRQLP